MSKSKIFETKEFKKEIDEIEKEAKEGKIDKNLEEEILTELEDKEILKADFYIG